MKTLVICYSVVIFLIGLGVSTAWAQQDSTGVTTRPGAMDFSPAQDSAYIRAKRLEISPYVRFLIDMQRLSDIWLSLKEQRRKDPFQVMNENIENIPPELYIPTGKELVRHQYNITMSQQTGLPTALPVTPGSGLQIPLSAIGAFLGLTEDVSPVISYSLESSAEVEVVVYSVQALVIRTLLTAKQYPGSYSITWDGKNDKGIIMPKGDYVAEVRIGKDRIVRKRIVVP